MVSPVKVYIAATIRQYTSPEKHCFMNSTAGIDVMVALLRTVQDVPDLRDDGQIPIAPLFETLAVQNSVGKGHQMPDDHIAVPL